VDARLFPWDRVKADEASITISFVVSSVYSALGRQEHGVLATPLWRIKRQWHPLAPLIGDGMRKRKLLVVLAVVVAAG
jgi:hypothetical protein